MRTETDEIRDNLKYLTLLARDYPSQAAAASEIISTQALLKLPKGTEHFMSDLHGENEAFVHILNSASGVIREKVDAVLGNTMPEAARAELATLIYYPTEKLPQLKARCTTEDALEQWYTQTLLQLIDICRLVSSKHTRDHVRGCLPSSCGYILDELLHAHFEDHDKDLYYGQIVGSIIEIGRADRFIVRLCELIKHLAVDKLHIVGDLFDRGPRPDIILDLLMRHHNVDIQWGNHDVVWMGAAAGSPICICTVLKTTLAYHNHGMLEDCYGINLRHLQRMAEQFYGEDDLSIWMPHTDAARGPYTGGMLHRCAVMHKAISILMFKLECQVIDRNPDFQMQGRDYLRRIDWDTHTVQVGEKSYPLRDTSFPTVDPADPAKLNPDEELVLHKLVQSFRQSERLQQHIEFLYAKGSVYHIENGNLLYHGAVPMNTKGGFAVEHFEGRRYSGRALMDYCDARARRGYYGAEGSAARQSGQDFLWYLWCGKLSPLFGRSAMTTFERLYIAPPPIRRSRTLIIAGTTTKPPAAAFWQSSVCRARAISSTAMCRCRRKTARVPSRAGDGWWSSMVGSAAPTTKRPALRATRWCIPAAPCPCAPINPLKAQKRRCGRIWTSCPRRTFWRPKIIASSWKIRTRARYCGSACMT